MLIRFPRSKNADMHVTQEVLHGGLRDELTGAKWITALKNKLAAIKASDPVTSLRRGFSLVYRSDNQLVKSVKDVSQGVLLKTKVQDGMIVSTVKQTEEN